MIGVVIPILIREEWQLHMTVAAVMAHRLNAGEQIRLVLVGPPGEFGPVEREMLQNALGDGGTLHETPKGGTYTQDFNAGCSIISEEMDFIVHSGNDVFPLPGWAPALREPFEKFDDCGVSTVTVFEGPVCIGSPICENVIIEGHYGPFMMFSSGDRLDEAYIGKRSDDDLIVRQYQNGLRAYRNHAGAARHLAGATWHAATTEVNGRNDQVGNDVFLARYADSPLEIVTKILTGGVGYGREHQRFQQGGPAA